MKVNAPGYAYPHMFLIGGRAAGAAFPPVEAVGVLVVKQTVGFIGPVAQQPVLLTDVENPPPASPGDPHLPLKFEADLVPYKPVLDVVAVRASTVPATFGSVRLDRGSGFGAAMSLQYGWRDRRVAPRLAQAGNAAAFVPPAVTDPANPPPLTDRLKLPDGFQNAFFNGRPLGAQTHLKAGDVVRFDDGAVTRDVTIPARPVVTIIRDGTPLVPAPPITTSADTVVMDLTASRFLVSWRAVFAWSSTLESAELEVQ